MKIFIREILPAGIEVARGLTIEDIGLDKDGIELSSPLATKASVKRVGDTVLVHVRFDFRFSTACARCLEESEKAFSVKTDFDYSIDSTTEWIDLGEDIRQEVILNITQRALCSPDCKGLCPECGANLNLEECRCKEDQQPEVKSQKIERQH